VRSNPSRVLTYRVVAFQKQELEMTVGLNILSTNLQEWCLQAGNTPHAEPIPGWLWSIYTIRQMCRITRNTKKWLDPIFVCRVVGHKITSRYLSDCENRPLRTDLDAGETTI
jgi:hypothetical protein